MEEDLNPKEEDEFLKDIDSLDLDEENY